MFTSLCDFSGAQWIDNEFHNLCNMSSEHVTNAPCVYLWCHFGLWMIVCLFQTLSQPASQPDFQSFMHLFLALLSHNYVCDGLLVRSPTRRRKTTKEWKKSITNRHTIYDRMISIVGAWFLCTLYSWTFNCAKSHKALNISNKHCRCVKTTNSTEKNIECHFVIWNSNKKKQSKSSTK